MIFFTGQERYLSQASRVPWLGEPWLRIAQPSSRMKEVIRATPLVTIGLLIHASLVDLFFSGYPGSLGTRESCPYASRTPRIDRDAMQPR